MELTNCQLESLHRERERRLQLRNDEIVRRVSLQTKQMFYQRNVSQVLRIRVVDAKNPTKTALLSIWHPSEDIQDLVKPGNFIQVSGASASKMDFEKELTISSSKMTIIKKIQRSLDLQKFQPFLRVLTPFSAFKDSSFAPLHNEFDIICLVVHIGEKPVNPRNVFALNFIVF